MALKEQFEIPGGLKKWSFALMGVGVLTLILGIIFLHPFSGGHGEAHGEEAYGATKFWMALMHNSIFWLLVVAASFFFIAATTLAQAGWPLVFRRVPEAISGSMNVLGPVTLVILLAYVWISDDHHIYHWKDAAHLDEKLQAKSGFLNPTFYTVVSIVSVSLWIWFRNWFRKLSITEDQSVQRQTANYWRTLAVSAAFLVTYGLTVLSTLPWLWLMSIDAHWFSTMYSWYTFASSWVAGLSLMMLFVVYLKNHGYLDYVSEEHIHDIGKFIFAFSIFWTYLWFSQFMLIWYSNQPEETAYFIDRLGYGGKGDGPFRAMFLLNLIINFLAPLLILMRRSSKRSYTVVTLMSVVLIFGHWLDFYQMITPGPLKELGKDSNPISHFVYSLGIAAGFLGLVIFLTARYLTKASLLPKNHPLVKESIIHHT